MTCSPIVMSARGGDTHILSVLSWALDEQETELKSRSKQSAAASTVLRASSPVLTWHKASILRHETTQLGTRRCFLLCGS